MGLCFFGVGMWILSLRFGFVVVFLDVAVSGFTIQSSFLSSFSGLVSFCSTSTSLSRSPSLLCCLCLSLSFSFSFSLSSVLVHHVAAK